MPRLSTIISIRNDAAALGCTLDYLSGLEGMVSIKVMVAASGGPDGTEQAVAGRARLLWPAGSTRAILMNAGAAQARGEVLFFLHADALPPAGGFELIEQALADDRVVDAFEQLFAEPAWCLRLIIWINRHIPPNRASDAESLLRGR
jgi:hypothetical protein